ncbi:MAG TPA: diaminopimelate decarboxylase, partial [Desulfosarcina sp.]|nr:diaminopimelate decarboxylase [Desulfosarcina sp.]
IRETGRTLTAAFGTHRPFREYFAVKALPNLHILAIMGEMGFGFDCSSIPELVLSRMAGGSGEDIMFTSNNTTAREFAAALADGGSIINLDDISLVDKVKPFPDLICFRYNPGPRRTGNAIIGNPAESKYGVSHDQIVSAYRMAIEHGARRFGLHTMIASNELDYRNLVETTRMILAIAALVGRATGIRFEFVNIGGGIGIPYHPDQEAFDLTAMAAEVEDLFRAFRSANGYRPGLSMECGRFMTGPHGVLVTRVINFKSIYREYVGVDACMSALMCPAMYGAYHHITVPGRPDGTPSRVVDVVGALCENNDKFAIQRSLPAMAENDLLVIHDTGAHGHAMGFTYNGRLQPKELLLRSDGTVELIRREQRLEDYLATQTFAPDVYRPAL